MKPIVFFFVGIVVFVFFLYKATAARSAINYADSNDLILAAWGKGLAHPPGYPLVIGLYRLFIQAFPGIEPAVVCHNVTAATQAMAAGMLFLAICQWFRLLSYPLTIPNVMVITGGVWAWAIRSQTWMGGTVTEVFALNNLLLAGFLGFVYDGLQKKHLSFGWWSLYLMLGGLLFFQHALMLIPVLVITGWMWRRRHWPIYTAVSVIAAMVGIGMLATFSYRMFDVESSLYSWPIPQHIFQQLHFFWRTLYETSGSHIETYVHSWEAARIGYSLLLYTRLWLGDTGMVGILFIAGLIYAFKAHSGSFKALALLWLLSGPLLLVYLKFPYQSEGEAIYYLGTALRLRMFYIATLIETFFMVFGLYRLKVLSCWPQTRWLPVVVGLLLSLQTLHHYKEMDVSNDNTDTVMAERVLHSIPPKGVLMVDTDDYFSIAYQQARHGDNIQLISLRMPITTPASLPAMRFLESYGYERNDKDLPNLVAAYIQAGYRVFLFDPGKELIAQLGLEGNPFYAKPHGYVLEVTKEKPDYRESFDYGLSKALSDTNETTGWRRGYKATIAQIHIYCMYYFGVNGFNKQANEHEALAVGLLSFEQSRKEVEAIKNAAISKYETYGAFVHYDIPDFTGYQQLADKANARGKSEEAGYYLTRNLLAHFYAPQAHVALAQWWLQQDKAIEAEKSIRRAQLVSETGLVSDLRTFQGIRRE